MDIIYILTAFVLTPVAENHQLAAFGTLYECETILKEAEKELLDDVSFTCVGLPINDEG
jgi:hypothetical protein